jgi:glucokinase
MSITIGMDIGGTSVKLLALDQHATIRGETSFRTSSQQGIESFLSATDEAIQLLLNQGNAELSGLGVGCTGPIDYQTGIILNPFTLPGLEGHSISELLSERYHVPVVVDNDANAAHLGEVFLQDDAPDDTMMITFGTGVGVSIRLQGALFRIPGGIHPEIGHIPTSIKAEDTCYCNRNNCMEHILSGTGINNHALQEYEKTAEALMEDPNSTFRLNLETALFESVSSLATIFHPQVVYVGGGMQQFYETYLLRHVQQRLDALLPIYGRTRLQGCKAGSRAGSLGAALLAYKEGR